MRIASPDLVPARWPGIAQNWTIGVCAMTATTAPFPAKSARPVPAPASAPSPVTNPHVRKWIDECIELCKPDHVHYCNGSLDERKALFEQGAKDGVFIKLNQQKLPGCYLHR